MVRQIASRRPAAFAGTILVLAAAGVLLWHLLACTESPMAFSPDSKSLAFVIMDPYASKSDPRLAGPYQYRLMAVTNQKDINVIEETADAVLTGPAYSPDGSQLCYLRIPLPDKKQLSQCEEAFDQSEKHWKEFIESAASRPTAQVNPEAQWSSENQTIPDPERTIELLKTILAAKPAKAELVFRKTADYSVIRTMPLELPVNLWKKPGKGLPEIYGAYLMTRPQFSPDGKSIYLCIGDVLLALDPEKKVQKLLAFPAQAAVLSPDGKTIAFFQDGAIGFVQTDGSRSVFSRFNAAPLANSFAWADNATLAILCKSESATETKAGAASAPAASGPVEQKRTLVYMKTDGTVLPQPRIEISTKGGEDKFCELAVSRDGKNIAVSFITKVVFLDSSGKILNQIELEGQASSQPDNGKAILVQPTFSPDCRSVAFKKITNINNSPRPDAILFFTPEGKELSSVAIPPMKAGATRPAE